MRLATYGSGRTITELVRQIRPGPHRLVAAVVHSPQRGRQDLGVLTVGEPLDLQTTTDLHAVLASGDVDLLLYGGLLGDTHERVMSACAETGVDMIHACFAHPRLALPPETLAQLTEAAERSGARILGTGVMPGMWLDVLPALLATCVPDPVHIRARRISDLSSWGVEVLRQELGLGGPRAGPAPRYDAVLRESAQELADALGLDAVELRSQGGAITAAAAIRVGQIDVPAGTVEGFDHHVTAHAGGEEVFDLSWLALPEPETRGLRLGLDLTLVGGDGEELIVHARSPADPYPATAARMLKAVGPLTRLPPGLHLPAALAVA